MSPVGTKLEFEVLEFTATPGTSDVAVLQLEGRFRCPGRRRLGRPRLLAENAEERVEVGAADARDAVGEPDGAHWRASFAVPLRLLAGAEFALAVGRELLDLPAPDRDESANGASDLHVRLAREANALRGLADEARAAAAAALGRADAERGEREKLEAEMRGERHAREELATRLSQFESELGARDEAMEQLRQEHERELEEREAAVRAEGDERVAEVEAEAAELRRALKSARADIELLRRERDRATRVAATRVEAATTTPVATDASAHPERDAAARSLPLPEGEDVGPARPARGLHANGDGPAPFDEDALADGDDDDDVPPPTTVAGGRGHGLPAAAVAAGAEADADVDGESSDNDWSDDDGEDDGETEGVRVLGRRPRRARSGDEPPVEPLPGTAAIGARHIVPGDMGPAHWGPWIARLAAILALAIAIAAVLLIVLGHR